MDLRARFAMEFHVASVIVLRYTAITVKVVITLNFSCAVWRRSKLPDQRAGQQQ